MRTPEVQAAVRLEARKRPPRISSSATDSMTSFLCFFSFPYSAREGLPIDLLSALCSSQLRCSPPALLPVSICESLLDS